MFSVRISGRVAIHHAALIAILTGHAAALAHAAMHDSPTLNEPGHLVAGLLHISKGRFDVYCVNSPLVQAVAAIPVWIAGYDTKWEANTSPINERSETVMGEAFVKGNGFQTIHLMTLARWACIPFSLVGALCCYFWSRQLWQSRESGLLSCFLWCVDPNIIAHGHLLTSDCAATAFGLVASFLFWRWLRSSSWGWTFAAGVGLGMATLAKITWILLFALWPLIWAVWSFVPSNPQSAARSDSSRAIETRRVSKFVTIFLIGIYVLNCGYLFDGTFTLLGQFEFTSTLFGGSPHANKPGNRFAGTIIGSIPLPLPADFVRGIDLQRRDFEHYPYNSYLNGKWQRTGWWYYYLYGLLVKTTPGSQLLFTVATVTVLFFLSRGTRSDCTTGTGLFLNLLVLAAPAISVLALASSQTGFSHHFRYVLPVCGHAFVWSGAAAYWIKPSDSTNLLRRQPTN